MNRGSGRHNHNNPISDTLCATYFAAFRRMTPNSLAAFKNLVENEHPYIGYLEANPCNAYSLNNITAQKSPDGSVAVQFGGCDGKIPNCLPITNGWNYLVRLYRPRGEILSGAWFPEAQPIGAGSRALQ